MTTDDDESELEGLKRVEMDLRKGGGFQFKSRNSRDHGELDDAANALNALGLEHAGLTHRGRDDPPDCEAVVNGERWGIELVELADEPTLEQRANGGPMVHKVWTRDDFISKLQEIVKRKDKPAKLKGGPYDRYLLVVRTDGMHLTKACLEQFLAGTVFNCFLITDACVALDYHPGTPNETPHPYPAVRIGIARRNVSTKKS